MRNTHRHTLHVRETQPKEERAAQTRHDAGTKNALRYFRRRRHYGFTGRCPIHLCVLSACNWQPNNNNQSFGKCVLRALRSLCGISQRAIRFYIINVPSSFTVPFLFRISCERLQCKKATRCQCNLGVGGTQRNAHIKFL